MFRNVETGHGGAEEGPRRLSSGRRRSRPGPAEVRERALIGLGRALESMSETKPRP